MAGLATGRSSGVNGLARSSRAVGESTMASSSSSSSSARSESVSSELSAGGAVVSRIVVSTCREAEREWDGYDCDREAAL